MKISKITAICFSPTGGTRKYVHAIAEGVGGGYTEIDLTKPQVRQESYHFAKDELVIIGVPVYYGRMPLPAGRLLACLHGENTPAILAVSYGNRAYEDALAELADGCREQGFHCIGAGAFIAPHTFSDKVAKGRPNSEDLQAVKKFTADIKELLSAPALPAKAVDIPGNRPYRDVQPLPFAPKGTDQCTDCKACVSICPVGAIPEENPAETDAEKCICCLACVKGCPEHAREMNDPPFLMASAQLEENLLKLDQKPEFFIL